MLQRRADDILTRFHGNPEVPVQALPEESAFQVVAVAVDPEGSGTWPAPSPKPQELLLLRGLHRGEEEVIVAGSPIPVATAGGSAEVAVSAWREQRVRSWKRANLAEKLLDFFDDLSRAQTPEAIVDLAERHAARSAGGSHAQLVMRKQVGRTAEAKGNGGGCESLVSEPAGRLALPGLLFASEVEELGAPWREAIAGELEHAKAALVAHVPFGARGVLFLFERRSERIFDSSDWRLLSIIADHANRALERLELLKATQELSLTDPLTGLANRRQLDVVMKHAWAAAERGGKLAVLFLDLDNFKQINDQHGHSLGDQILQMVAECIRRETRGTDLAVRFGGDEFLVVMPGGTAEGARSLASRVRKHLQGWIEMSVGVACYHRGCADPLELIATADRELYRVKKARRNHAS